MTGYSTQLQKIINFKTTALTGQIYDEFYKFASKQEIPASNLMYNQQKVPLFSGLMLNELSSSQADKTILSVPLNLKIMKDQISLKAWKTNRL